MAEETSDSLITRVRSQTIPGVAGHCLNSARTNHFVVDDPAYAGGPGEELTADEVFLSGISACGALMVARLARADAIPFERVEANIEGIRLKSDPTIFQTIGLHFTLTGMDRQAAETLVERFKGR
jgi:uncharacterized OsmC-like protein